MAVMGVGLILWGALSIYQRRRGGPKGAGPDAALTPDQARQQMKQDRAMHRDLAEVATEVEQMAKRLGTQLDQQATRLEALIRQADARIAKLEQLKGVAGAGDAGSGPVPGVAKPEPASAPESNGLPAAPGAAGLPANDPLTRQVYQLADDGLKPPDIARKIGEHVGKIELILALRSV
jgi:hypothetical protein